MIITTQRSPLAWTIDTALTAMGWVGFFYLFTEGVVSILGENYSEAATATPGSLVPTVHTLVLYLAVACFNALLVVLWGKYRKYLFQAGRRSGQQDAVNDEQLASHFHLSCNQLHEIQDSRVTVIYHSNEGDIAHLETDQLRMQPAGNNSVYENAAKVA